MNVIGTFCKVHLHFSVLKSSEHWWWASKWVRWWLSVLKSSEHWWWASKWVRWWLLCWNLLSIDDGLLNESGGDFLCWRLHVSFCFGTLVIGFQHFIKCISFQYYCGVLPLYISIYIVPHILLCAYSDTWKFSVVRLIRWAIIVPFLSTCLHQLPISSIPGWKLMKWNWQSGNWLAKLKLTRWEESREGKNPHYTLVTSFSP